MSTSERKSSGVSSRNETFAARANTRIWEESPAEENPYIATACRCHGYDLNELMSKRSFVEVFYLLFRGELPTRANAQLLEQLMIALINPGPRHNATRAAMTAGIGKTDPPQILPISLSILGGTHLGAGSMEAAIRLFRKNRKLPATDFAETLLENAQRPAEGDWEIAPGFGSRFGNVDIMPQRQAEQLLALPADTPNLQWGCELAAALKPQGLGWLTTGVAAAVFGDLGFAPRAGAGLFQLLCAPGLFAHGIEQFNKPITAMPFVSDENYVIETD